MTVFIVTERSGDVDTIVGVFANEQDARDCAARDSWRRDYDEHEVE